MRAWAHVCYVVGLSHILETGMVCEHEALLDAPRGGGVWWDGERIKKGSSSLIPSSSGGKVWSAKLEGALHGHEMSHTGSTFRSGPTASDKCGPG